MCLERENIGSAISISAESSQEERDKGKGEPLFKIQKVNFSERTEHTYTFQTEPESVYAQNKEDSMDIP